MIIIEKKKKAMNLSGNSEICPVKFSDKTAAHSKVIPNKVIFLKQFVVSQQKENGCD